MQSCVMGNDDFLYTLLFADDRDVIALNRQDAEYVIKQLHKEYKTGGLYMDCGKTKQLVIEEGNPIS